MYKIIFILIVISGYFFFNYKNIEFFKSKKKRGGSKGDKLKTYCKPQKKIKMNGKCPALNVKCDDTLVKSLNSIIEKIKNNPNSSPITMSNKDLTKIQDAIKTYQKDCNYCMSNGGGDYKCMQAARQNLIRSVPMISKGIYPWKNYDWDYGNYISNNYSPTATCASSKPTIQQAYDNAMAFTKLIDGMIADPIPNKRSVPATKCKDSDYPEFKSCDDDYKCTATQNIKKSYQQEKPYQDPFLDNKTNGEFSSSYYFRVGDCPRDDIKNQSDCEARGYTWMPNFISKTMDSNSKDGSCFQPRYAFIDNSAKPFFNGSNMKGMIPAIANDLSSLTPDKILGAMSGASIDKVYSIQSCPDFSKKTDSSQNELIVSSNIGASKGSFGGSKGSSGGSKGASGKFIIGCSKNGSSKGGDRINQSSIMGRGFSRFSI